MKITAKEYARLLVRVSKDVAGDELDKRILSVLTLMQERGDAHMAPKMIEEMDEAYVKEAGGSIVQIETVGDDRSLIEAVAKILDKHEEEIKHVKNPQLIGGARLRIDNTIIDASIRGQLTDLRKQLAL